MSNSTVSKLDGLIGLDRAKHFVRRLAENDHGIHAILLYGGTGTGKTQLARLITELWLCTTPTSAGADGTCKACAAFGRGNSPDVLDIMPAGRSSIISVKAITNDNPTSDDPPTPLLKFFRTPPLFSRHKIAVIHDAHRMNYTAANALLKTLEEPHPHAKILLTTDTVGSLLPTIRSRCLAVACESPDLATLSNAFPNATADEIRIAEGNPGRLADIAKRREAFSRLLHFARSLPNRDLGEALIASEQFQAITEAFQTISDSGARAAQAEALDALATFYARQEGIPPEWTHLVIEAHRRILGNCGAAITFDALFTSMLLV